MVSSGRYHATCCYHLEEYKRMLSSAEMLHRRGSVIMPRVLCYFLGKCYNVGRCYHLGRYQAAGWSHLEEIIMWGMLSNTVGGCFIC
jgi:hypothetical protein